MPLDYSDPALIMKVHRMYENSRSFLLAAHRCFEVKPRPKGGEEVLLVPGVVCAAFSAEVALKALALCFGIQPPREHSLAKLFLLLPAEQQQSLIAFEGDPGARLLFLDRVEAIATTFQDWRYDYEKDSLGVSIGDVERLAERAQAIVESQLMAARARAFSEKRPRSKIGPRDRATPD